MRTPAELESYHWVWLEEHPGRTAEWLCEKLAEGFEIHHIDGDHGNDDPRNLVLVEHTDHMMIHNGSKRCIRRFTFRGGSVPGRRQKKRKSSQAASGKPGRPRRRPSVPEFDPQKMRIGERAYDLVERTGQSWENARYVLQASDVDYVRSAAEYYARHHGKSWPPMVPCVE